MKENYTHLYPNEKVAKKVADYSTAHSTPLPQHIVDLHAWASENHAQSEYMISPLQAQFHRWIAKAVGAKRILEIGCFIGFTAMGWSEAVGPEGHVTTLEFKPEFAKQAEEGLAKNGIKNVEVVVGDARETLKSIAFAITEPYDVIFIDADKSSYPTYLSLILSLSPTAAKTGATRLLRPGGIILADNILRRGLVADATDANPWSKLEKQVHIKWAETDIAALDKFNTMLVEDERLETFLMPMFDGLGMGRLKD